jgi:hypothetical protein
MGLAIEIPGTVFQNAQWAIGLAAARRDVFPLGGSVDGFWFDPWDMGSLFQDAAGTVPVTASGQPVGLMMDKSGNGNHAVQTDLAKRPVFTVDGAQKFLQFADGDHMDAIPPSGSWPKTKRTLIMAVRVEGGDSSSRTLAEAFENDPNTGANVWSALVVELLLDGSDWKLNIGANYPTGPDVATAFPIGVDDIVSYRLDYVNNSTPVDAEIRSGGVVQFSDEALDPVDASAAPTGVRLFAGRGKDDTLAGRLYGAAYVRSYVDPVPVEAAFAERAGITLGA